MPVATLRVWERRYGLGCARVEDNGRRLYSEADVQRIAWLKRLTERGHGIGGVARLDLERLQDLGRGADTLPGRAPEPAAAEAGPARVAVVGQALGEALRRHLGPASGLVVVACVDRLDGLGPDAPGLAACDLLLVGASTLHGLDGPRLRRLGQALGARQVGVVYGFGAARDRARLATAGIELLREPREPTLIQGWLGQLARQPAPPALPEPAAEPGHPSPPPDAPPARRYDEALLTRVATQVSSVACECPRHVAEILLQLSQFEDYSAGCAHRSPEDAALHADLTRAASTARAIFEMALERVARHEGIALDAPGR